MTSEDWLFQADVLLEVRSLLLIEENLYDETDMLAQVIAQVEAEAGAEWVREQRAKCES